METSLPSRGGWLTGQPNSTGSSLGITKTTLACAAVFLIQTGTGVSMDDLDQLRYMQKGIAINRPLQVCSTPSRTSAEDITRIREFFSPAVSELANTFGVSRQAIYNWINGGPVTPEHADKLRDFSLAADILAGTDTPMKGTLLKRKITEGKNLLEIIRDGGSAQNAAQTLLSILQRENSQKEMLKARFAGRTATTPSADADLIAENDMV